MLVLTRKTNQRIAIGNDIVITLLHVKGNTVRIGVEAPADVRVLRQEIVDRIRLEETSGDDDSLVLSGRVVTSSTAGLRSRVSQVIAQRQQSNERTGLPLMGNLTNSASSLTLAAS